MNIQEFTDKRPHLYHLTDQTNLRIILETRTLLSTKVIAKNAFGNTKAAKDFLRTKRENHAVLHVDGLEYKIRDQNPILMKVLERSLEGDIDTGDFLELLNKRVFMWPTLDRLYRHYNRYVGEKPVILKVNSDEMLDLNKNVEFCRLNSGATRCHPTYGGNAPTRGANSFLSAARYENTIASVAEVTFPDSCKLSQNVWVANNPAGPWKKI